MPWKLTVRVGPRVEHNRFDALDDALSALEERAAELARSAPRASVNAKFKRFEPIQQVTARIELSGPERLIASVHAGVDVRGDGSTEAYTGKLRREIVERRKGESPCRALRRALEAGATR